MHAAYVYVCPYILSAAVWMAVDSKVVSFFLPVANCSVVTPNARYAIIPLRSPDATMAAALGSSPMT